MKWEQPALFDRVTFHGGGAHGRAMWMWWTDLPLNLHWYWPIFESPSYGFGSPEPSGRAWRYEMKCAWDPMGQRCRYWYDFESEVKM